MLSTSKLAVFAALVASVNALTIDTPASLIVCQPVSIAWSGGSSTPYYLAAIPGGEVSGSALENIATVDSSPYSWTVDLAAGTNITLKITDGSGNIAYSSAVVIQSGSSTSCVGASTSASSASSSTAAADAVSSAAASSAAASGSSSTSKAVSGSSGSSSTSKAASSTTSASASTSSSAAGHNVVAGGALAVAGLVAAVVAA